MRYLLCWLLLVTPGVARAEWLRASSDHFVVYADDQESDVRKFTRQLESYDAAMAVVSGRNRGKPSPSNRVTVFIVKNENEVRKLYGAGAKYIAAFYVPRAGRSIAIVPQVKTGTTNLDFSMIMLLHEYAHHFLISSTSFPLPRWVSEGAAEFYSSAAFGNDGSVDLGRPALHRAAELAYAVNVPATDLLDPASCEEGRRKGFDAYYGKAWLLFHYLMFDKARAGQMDRYLDLLTAGKGQREAAETAFGDLKKLEGDLVGYKGRSRMTMMRLPPAMLNMGPMEIEIARLSAGEAAAIPLVIRSSRGVNEQQAAALVEEARALAKLYPDDRAVLSELAEAEHDAKHDAASIAAADAALALDPRQVNAYVQKGLSQFRSADSAADKNAAFKLVRSTFAALNRIENDHPLPLLYFYQSYLAQGSEPPLLAKQGLQRASELAPSDLGLRMTLAMQQIRDKQVEAARSNLKPIAFNPHGGGLAQAAQAVMERLDKEPDWDGRGFEPPADDEKKPG